MEEEGLCVGGSMCRRGPADEAAMDRGCWRREPGEENTPRFSSVVDLGELEALTGCLETRAKGGGGGE